MTYLDVGENELNIESLGGLSALRELVMPCNCMQSAVIGKGQFQSLQHLDLSFNSVAASSLATFEHLISLETLNLSNNGLAQVPLELSTLPCLSNLDLSSNLFATDDVLITLRYATFLVDRLRRRLSLFFGAFFSSLASRIPQPHSAFPPHPQTHQLCIGFENAESVAKPDALIPPAGLQTRPLPQPEGV
jgi:hypothetical protein